MPGLFWGNNLTQGCTGNFGVSLGSTSSNPNITIFTQPELHGDSWNDDILNFANIPAVPVVTDQEHCKVIIFSDTASSIVVSRELLSLSKP